MKTNKTGRKFIVFWVLISLVPLFVTCENQEEEPWEPPSNNYTVIYDKNAVDATGTMENSFFTVGASEKLRINSFVRNNYCFLGWAKTAANTIEEYTDGQSIYDLTTAGKTITLYAVWHEAYTVEVTAGNTLAEKFIWIKNNAESYTTYITDINSDNNLYNQTLDYGAKKNVTIHLKGTGSISKGSSSSPLFSIPKGVTLILDGNLTLSSGTSSGSFYPMISVNGNLIMNGGEISGNGGGGVYVNRDGTFTMNGGEISGNSGGGVCVDSGTFTMNGGEISGNSGGGVYVIGGFTKVNNGTFTMNGGEISGNSDRGVSVCVRTTWSSDDLIVSRGTFTMNGGEISGNTSGISGGGVYVTGIFYKIGGIITGSNSTNSNVVKDYNGNIVNNKGRAVYVDKGNIEKRKETTAGPGDNLSFTYDEWGVPTWSGAWDY